MKNIGKFLLGAGFVICMPIFENIVELACVSIEAKKCKHIRTVHASNIELEELESACGCKEQTIAMGYEYTDPEEEYWDEDDDDWDEEIEEDFDRLDNKVEMGFH